MVADAMIRPVVLLVDDNPAMRALIRSLVEPGSSVVHECEDAESALALYDRLHPDWVLMDIKMGGMDGIAATRAIREADPRAQVIIVTEMGSEPFRRAAAAAGATGFLLKQNLLDLPGMLVPRPETRAG